MSVWPRLHGAFGFSLQRRRPHLSRGGETGYRHLSHVDTIGRDSPLGIAFDYGHDLCSASACHCLCGLRLSRGG